MSNYKIKEGVEHYRDVARNEHPEWIGWKVIDYLKNKYGNFYECQDKCGDLKYLYNKFKKQEL